MRFTLRAIPEPLPGSRSILASTDQVAIQGPLKGVAFDCGGCGLPIVKGVVPGDIQNMVFRCHGCGAFNESDAISDE